MKTQLYYLSLLLLLGLFSTSLPGQTVDPDYVDGMAYVKIDDASTLSLDPYNNSIPALNLIFSTFGVDTTYKTFKTQDPLVDKIFTIEFTDINGVSSLISQLSVLPFIDYAERVPYLTTTGTSYIPNDLQTAQWGLAKVNAPLAWDLSQGDPNVVIAIVDNAIQLNHEDLAGNLWVNGGEIPGNFLDDDLNGFTDDVNGYDVANRDGDPNPPASARDTTPWVHGTHCAGIASASTDNGKGIAGLGFNCRIMAVKSSLDQTDGTWVPNGFEGIDYAISAGADIISCSWGGKGTSLTGERIVQLALLRGAIIIAAAGNSDESTENNPAAYPGVIAVGSTGQLDTKSGFSNYGTWIDVMAPGSGILSSLAHTTDDSYGFLSGTSMSTPLVAGLAGLVLSANPSMTAAQVETAIKDGCDNIDSLNPSYIGKLGAGRINAFATLAQFTSLTPPTLESSLSMVAYPNPFRETLQLKLETNSKGTISILDLQGRTMTQEPVRESRMTELNWDTRNWANGIYFLQYVSEDEVISTKLLKQ